MPNRLLILVALSASVALAESSARAITVAELQKQIKAGQAATIIDVRMPELFASGHIPGAINVPASVCTYKNLPPLGKVIVYGTGVYSDGTAAAAAALSHKPGISTDVLRGGYAAWESAHSTTTRAQGMQPEVFNYITYEDLKKSNPNEVLLVDLRHKAGATHTDLKAEFPTHHVAAAAPLAASDSALTILIDDGDGTAQAKARQLKANGNKRYAILIGGELALARKGKTGTQRTGSNYRLATAARPTP